MSIVVSDPFEVTRDRAMPTLAFALDPAEVQRQFRQDLWPRIGRPLDVDLLAIRVTRYKAGRRCLIEYDLELSDTDATRYQATWLGKVRAGHDGNAALGLVETFWEAGFDAASADGISVPQPIGALPQLQLWLQRKVPGMPATKLLWQRNAADLMARIAQAAHKVHCAGVAPRRTHTMADELAILHDRLGRLSEARPEWKARLSNLLTACDRLGSALPACTPCAIHRDFYADQVIVDRDLLTLIDFDLYCWGDPGLDVGNFIGHITEYSLRSCGDAMALAPLEDALESRFAELAGEDVRQSVRTYALLTLVRHVYLSTLFAQRRPFTEALLELCETRLATNTPTRGRVLTCCPG